MTSELLYPKPADEAFSDAQKSLSAIGKVTKSNINDYTIDGKARYGLQSVKVRISVHPNHDASNIVIEAESDDIWDTGGKSVVNRFLEALKSTDNPEYEADRQGVSTAKLIGMLALFLAILIPCISVTGSKHLGGGVVLAHGGILYFDLDTVEEITERTVNSPGVEQFARRVVNSSNPNAVAPALSAYASSFQQSIERDFEAAGMVIRVPANTSFKAIRKMTDAYGVEIYKVRLLLGSHSQTEGYMHSYSLRFEK